MTCPQLVESGVYVLGALPPAQRLAFEAHMAGCDECRNEVNELAVLPGLLGRVDAETFEVGSEASRSAEAQPVGVLPEMLSRVGRTRRIHRAAALAGALALACLALLAGLAMPDPQQRHSPPTAASSVAMHPMRELVNGSPITASVGLTSVTGGTAISVDCTYGQGLGSAPRYRGSQSFALFVYPRGGGNPQQIGTWSARPGDRLTIPAVTAWGLNDVARVELRSADGIPLLNYDVS